MLDLIKVGACSPGRGREIMKRKPKEVERYHIFHPCNRGTALQAVCVLCGKSKASHNYDVAILRARDHVVEAAREWWRAPLFSLASINLVKALRALDRLEKRK